MDSGIHDPNNHVPAVTPDDVWGDAEGTIASHGGIATILPPKRTGQADANTYRQPEGLRIESKPQARETGNQLEIQEISGSVLRLDPEIQSENKVPRVFKFQERPPRIEKTNPSADDVEWGNQQRKHPLVWIIGVGVVVCATLVVAMMLQPVINEPNSIRPGQEEARLILDPDEDISTSEALENMLQRQPEAEQVFRKYASARIPDDVLLTVRDAKAIAPLVRARPLPAPVSKDWVPPDNTTWTVLTSNGKVYGILEGTMPDYSKFAAYLVLSGGMLHLDWKATTGYGSASFTELRQQQGDPSEIRARVAPSDFFTSAFPESQYDSYQLYSPDDSEIVWGYVRRGENTAASLARLFLKGNIIQDSTAPKKVTVRLAKGPEGALPHQWLITGVQDDWITP